MMGSVLSRFAGLGKLAGVTALVPQLLSRFRPKAGGGADAHSAAPKAPKPPKNMPTQILLGSVGASVLVLGVTLGWLLSDPTARDPGEPSVLQPLKPAPPPPVVSEDSEAPLPVEAPPASPDQPLGQMALRAVPNRALVEQGADGPLPIIAPDGRRSWKVYARPERMATGRAKIAIFTGGLGLNQKTTDAALARLPGQVTLGYSALSPNLPNLIAAARARGHEIMIDLPMEPDDLATNDPGPYTMLTTVSATENTGRLEWLMSRAPGFVGMAATLGDKFMLEEGAARPVLETLRGRGLMILDTRALPRSVIARLADGIGLPYGIGSVVVDDDPAPQAIAAKLAKLEDIARVQGSAIGIAHPYAITNEKIDQWARTLDQRNIQLAPVTALVTAPQ